MEDGDTIHAVIRGSAVNNDGSVKVGYTAPSVAGQSAAVAAALADAGVRPDEIGYVEAHGTATRLGDPIEVASLTKAFRAGTDQVGYCAIGSVKGNVGHLDRASGVTGLIKVVLALEREEIPATLHYERPNPEIEFATSPFYVARQALAWPRVAGRPRRAGVNSLGVGGTNAHVVVEEAPGPGPSGPSRAVQVLVLSARTAAALEAATARLRAHLTAAPAIDAGGCGVHAAGGAAGHGAPADAGVPRRRGGGGAADASGRGPRRVDRRAEAGDARCRVRRRRGGGAGRPRRGARGGGTDLPGGGHQCRRLVPDAREETAAAQTFIAQWAQAPLWRSWGVTPTVGLGTGVGEYVAACVAGVLTVEDGLRLAAGVIERPRGSLTAPRLPLLSAVTGTWLTTREATDAKYWARTNREPRHEAAAIAALLRDDEQVTLVLGSAELGDRIRRHPACRPAQAARVFPSPPRQPRPPTRGNTRRGRSGSCG